MKIDVKVKKTIAHRLFIWLVYLSVLIHFSMLVSQIIGIYFYWVSELLLYGTKLSMMESVANTVPFLNRWAWL